MVIFVINLIVVILWAAAVHLIFKNKITFKEALLQAGIATVISIMVIFAIYYKDMGDTGIINGQVTGKERVKVSCGHSYRCNCYTTCSSTGKTRTCTQHCSTCYEHSYDVDWRVYTSVGNLEIDRINRQGTKEPPRWTMVQIGEPASNTQSYVNYVKAAPKSLFAMDNLEGDAAKYGALIPKYPRIYDYYRINHVIQVGVTYPQAKELNDLLSMALRTLGPSKQVNINVLFVKTTDTNYRYALERAWLGGKKNDVNVIVGMDANNTFSWVDTMTFGKNAGNEMLAVLLRDRIKDLVSRQQFGNATMLSDVLVNTITSNFHRKAMKDFEYLKEDYSPSDTAIIWFVIIQLLVLTGTTIFFYHFELERGDWASTNRSGSLLNRLHVPNYRVTTRSNRYY